MTSRDTDGGSDRETDRQVFCPRVRSCSSPTQTDWWNETLMKQLSHIRVCSVVSCYNITRPSAPLKRRVANKKEMTHLITSIIIHPDSRVHTDHRHNAASKPARSQWTDSVWHDSVCFTTNLSLSWNQKKFERSEKISKDLSSCPAQHVHIHTQLSTGFVFSNIMKPF